MFRSKLAGLRAVVNRGRMMSSSAGDARPAAYSGPVQFFHWTMGGSIVAAIGLVLAAQNTQDKKEKANYMFYHKSFGLLAFGLLGPRLVARLTSKAPGGVVGASALEHAAASLSHVALYGFAIFLPVSGVIMGAYSGFGLPFFYTTVPSIEKKPAVAKQAYELHKIAGQALEYFLPLHVAGALFHVVRGHVIFARILGSGGNVAKAASKTPKA